MGYWVKQESSCNRRVIETGTDLARRFELLEIGLASLSLRRDFVQISKSITEQLKFCQHDMLNRILLKSLPHRSANPPSSLYCCHSPSHAHPHQ